ncbi:class I SAM-dependent methyltransferase [Aliidiomarina soli]|uniref:class I SAM-dependent methyltransferase n=1 Tax=Aliidiomarina soli TaxID=1928574 RepID=UPI001F543194|nr:methyltransferase domain-containing protein [Aliidiomarina soli]
MKITLLTASVLACIYTGPVYAWQQGQPPVDPEVVEENEPEDLDLVRDVAGENGELQQNQDNAWSDVESMTLQQAIAAPHRSAANRQRDEYRNPRETLEFFAIEPDMTVVEIWPGAGWYTEILAPYLAANGTFYAAHFPADTDSDYFNNARNNFLERMQSSNVYSKVQVTEFSPGSAHDIAPEGSADMVLTFRNLHNWYMNGGDESVSEAFDAFYRALRPGGVLGVVDHRLPEDRDSEQARSSGYIKQSWAIEMAEQAGFELEDSSEVNANARDTADYEEGVWTLPPSLRTGDEGGEFSQIGESDRFTLKFRKPEE